MSNSKTLNAFLRTFYNVYRLSCVIFFLFYILIHTPSSSFALDSKYIDQILSQGETIESKDTKQKRRFLNNLRFPFVSPSMGRETFPRDKHQQLTRTVLKLCEDQELTVRRMAYSVIYDALINGGVKIGKTPSTRELLEPMASEVAAAALVGVDDSDDTIQKYSLMMLRFLPDAKNILNSEEFLKHSNKQVRRIARAKVNPDNTKEVSIDDDEIEETLAALKNSSLQESTLHSLKYRPGKAIKVLPAVLELLDHTNVSVQYAAADVLTKLKTVPDETPKAIYNLLAKCNTDRIRKAKCDERSICIKNTGICNLNPELSYCNKCLKLPHNFGDIKISNEVWFPLFQKSYKQQNLFAFSVIGNILVKRGYKTTAFINTISKAAETKKLEIHRPARYLLSLYESKELKKNNKQANFVKALKSSSDGPLRLAALKGLDAKGQKAKEHASLYRKMLDKVYPVKEYSRPLVGGLHLDTCTSIPELNAVRALNLDATSSYAEKVIQSALTTHARNSSLCICSVFKKFHSESQQILYRRLLDIIGQSRGKQAERAMYYLSCFRNFKLDDRILIETQNKLEELSKHPSSVVREKAARKRYLRRLICKSHKPSDDDLQYVLQNGLDSDVTADILVTRIDSASPRIRKRILKKLSGLTFEDSQLQRDCFEKIVDYLDSNLASDKVAAANALIAVPHEKVPNRVIPKLFQRNEVTVLDWLLETPVSRIPDPKKKLVSRFLNHSSEKIQLKAQKVLLHINAYYTDQFRSNLRRLAEDISSWDREQHLKLVEEYFRRRKINSEAVDSNVFIGEVSRLLESPLPKVKRMTIQKLIDYAPDKLRTLLLSNLETDLIVKLVQDPDRSVRTASTDLLIDMFRNNLVTDENDIKIYFSLVMKLLSDDYYRSRYGGIFLLRNFAKEYIYKAAPRLLEMLQETDPEDSGGLVVDAVDSIFVDKKITGIDITDVLKKRYSEALHSFLNLPNVDEPTIKRMVHAWRYLGKDSNTEDVAKRLDNLIYDYSNSLIDSVNLKESRRLYKRLVRCIDALITIQKDRDAAILTGVSPIFSHCEGKNRYSLDLVEHTIHKLSRLRLITSIPKIASCLKQRGYNRRGYNTRFVQRYCRDIASYGGDFSIELKKALADVCQAKAL